MIDLLSKTRLGRSGHVRFPTFGRISHVSDPKLNFFTKFPNDSALFCVEELKKSLDLSKMHTKNVDLSWKVSPSPEGPGRAQIGASCLVVEFWSRPNCDNLLNLSTFFIWKWLLGNSKRFYMFFRGGAWKTNETQQNFQIWDQSNLQAIPTKSLLLTPR